MEILNEQTIRITVAIIGSLMTIITTIVAVFAYKNSSYNRRSVQDFEQAYKYFSKENITKTESEHEILKDMACNTVSYFKGKKFDTIRKVIENDISLFDFSNLERLRNRNYLNEEYKLNDKYKKTVPAKTKEKFLWALLIIYSLLVVTGSVWFDLVSSIFGHLIIIFMIGVAEIPMLIYIDNQKRLDWFKSHKNELLSKSTKIITDKNAKK